MNSFKKIGFIGCGNMASAIVGGIIKSKKISPSDIFVYDVSETAVNNAKENFGVASKASAVELAESSDLIILAVKPQYCGEVIDEIKPKLTSQKILLSIAAGKTIDFLKSHAGDMPIIRTMPNTPALVSEGMTSISQNNLVTANQLNDVKELLETFGKAEVVPESLIDAVIGVSGSSPAYVFIMIEAMADSAVNAGMARDMAYKFVAQAVLGSAKMVLESGKHPAELKDMVCSPGGTTIEAVQKLEETGFRASIMSAINAAVKKSKKMSKK